MRYKNIEIEDRVDSEEVDFTITVGLTFDELNELSPDGIYPLSKRTVDKILGMQCKLKDYKIIFNDPATILFVGDKKYVVKAHDEEFDAEKGLSMALLRYFGISHLDLKRMIKSAEVQSKRKKTSTNKEEIYVNGEKLEQPELDSKREKLYKEIPQRNTKDYMTKTPFYFDIPTSDIDSGFKVPMVEEKVVVSPKGKHRGFPYNFNVGDKVIVRDCKYYKYTTNANAKQLLNKVWEIAQDNSDFSGSLYVINGVEFAGSELEPVKD